MVPSAVEAGTATMTQWRLTLSYDGTGFHGWQVQPELRTVQGELAAALERVTGERLLPQGSGRTDAGVHALGQVASMELAGTIPAANLLRALNHGLPPSVRVLRVEAVEKDFHARYCARRKTYEYRIFERKVGGEERVCSPFLAGYVWDCQWALDVERMQRAVVDFVGEKDWTSFAAVDPDLTERTLRSPLGSGEAVHERGTGANVEEKSGVRTVFAAGLAREVVGGEELLVIRVTGSGFLHHMVRNMVGTLAEIGRGVMEADAVPGILASRSRAAAGPTAPAHGLYLVSVEYGE